MSHAPAPPLPTGHPGQRPPRALPGRRLRGAARAPAARVRPRPAGRRGVGLRPRGARVYFELRDARGAVPCSMWRDGLRPPRARAWLDGVQVVVAGGCDYYPGSAAVLAGLLLRGHRACGSPARGTCSPSSSGCGGASSPRACASRRRRSPRPALPRTIGVVMRRAAARRATTCSPGCGAAAGRAGWSGRSPRCRTATPRRGRGARCSELAALPDVDVVIVARGGGSLADLLAFCDETLCRTVALLRVPVIASVGHHTDRTLIDDVAAVSCSTPTHAAEAAVPLARRRRARGARARIGAARQPRRRAVADRARVLARLSRAPGEHVARQRRALHQDLRELRASARRRVDAEEAAPRGAPRRWPGVRRRPPARRGRRASASWTASRWRSPRTTPSARSPAATRSSRTPPAGP